MPRRSTSKEPPHVSPTADWVPDVMISAFASYGMSQRLPNAKVILYSDAGHAFLFQHAEEFGHEVLRFLR